MSDTSVDTENDIDLDDPDIDVVENGDTTTQPIAVEPVAGGEAVIDYQTFAGETLVGELPDQTAVDAMVGTMFLLFGYVDETHAVTNLQMGVIVSYIHQSFEAESTFEEAVTKLRTKFVRGKQKDWNIVQGIANETRQLTAHELMSDRQMDMMFDAIVPALQSRTPHWDPDIQGQIDRLQGSTRTTLLNQAVSSTTKGDVTLFMRKFNGLCGQPQRQGAQNTRTDQATPAGAGKPGGNGEAW